MESRPSPAAERDVCFARLAVGAVFLANLSAALPYLLRPDRYAAGYELQGAGGEALVRGIGVLFLIWNATFPPVLLDPVRHRALFGVILAQQAIGLAGELWILGALPAGHAPLAATGARFVAFDLTGLVAMALAFWALDRRRRRAASSALGAA